MSQRYEIREEIGKGGLGAVYKAFDNQLHREVAMKRVLTTEHATEEEVQAAGDKLITEAKTLSSLNHPNIVTVFDVGQDKEGGFVVMELLNGETLDETVERGVLTQDDFIEIVYQTMEALLAAQAIDVLHRDLKPTNVMVIWQPSGKFQTKILDFGLAKFSKSPSVQTMDQEDAVMGSIYFMAPEQFERSELDARSDLYQIGCVYYHALTGQYPFRGDTAPQVMNAHLQHRVTPLEKLRPDMSPSICQWVMWLINREMENRPASAQEALDRFPRNPEPPNSAPVLQAIPVEETPVSATTGVQVILPSHSAAPPSVTVVSDQTGSAPILKTGSAPISRAHTGSTPIRHVHSGPIAAPRKSNKKPLIFSLISVGVIILALIVSTVIKSAKASAERNHLKELANPESANPESPQGDADDIALAIKFLESKTASREEKGYAEKVLNTVQGPGIDNAIISSLGSSQSAFVRLELCQAAAERGLSGAVPAMMGAFNAASSDNQKSGILNSVREVATKEDIPTLLASLGGSHSLPVRAIFEDIIIDFYRSQAPDPSTTGSLLKRLIDTSDEERRSLFRILGALGTQDVLTRLQTIYGSGSDIKLQLDATAAFMSWPDRSALPLVENILANTDNNALKIVAGRAYSRISGLPSAAPLSQKIEAWSKGFGLVAKAQDMRRIFGAAAETPAPEVKTLLQSEFRDPSLTGLAKQAIAEMDRYIKGAPAIGGGETLPPGKAKIVGDALQGAVYNPQSETLVAWQSPDVWFLWHFKVKEAGNYGFAVMQSYLNDNPSEFEIIVGEQTFSGASQKTTSADEFTAVKLDGSIALDPDKVHTLILRGRGITQPRMMNIKGILVEKR